MSLSSIKHTSPPGQPGSRNARGARKTLRAKASVMSAPAPQPVRRVIRDRQMSGRKDGQLLISNHYLRGDMGLEEAVCTKIRNVPGDVV